MEKVSWNALYFLVSFRAGADQGAAWARTQRHVERHDDALPERVDGWVRHLFAIAQTWKETPILSEMVGHSLVIYVDSKY